MKNMIGKNTKLLFDSSALMKLFKEEKGHETVNKLITRAARGEMQGIVSCITIVELLYALGKIDEKIAYECLTYLENLPLEIMEVTKAISKKAGTLKLKYVNKHISTADAIIIATAIENNVGKVVTADRVWAEIPEINALIV